ncbi:MAG: primosomal protein N' [Opitutales bacterium]|nr:primosomal protein N' [Opitutales bacterium]MCH8541733.1 primosomal protein N' [Opitutales bacterium]
MKNNPAETVGIWPLTGIRRELDYRLPEHLQEKVRPGSLVRVPLGRRSCLGVVARMPGEGPWPLKDLKLVTQVVQDQPVFTPTLLRLAEWVRDYYAAPMESVLETMIPKPVRQGMSVQTVKFLAPGKKVLAEGALAALKKKAPRQWATLAFVREQVFAPRKSLVKQRLSITDSVIKGLLEKELLREEERVADRDAYEDDLADQEVVASGHDLNDEQTTAVDNVAASLAKEEYATHLLHGVTGSGKTEVYLHLIRRALDMGRTVIYLVPELALTSQTVGRLRRRMEQECGVQTAVWHSMLSAGERLDAWRKLNSNEARIVVGARSAIFAPLQKVGLIVVDEEHEAAYKQAETPRYHGRDTAVYRARLENAVCLLGSATPSVESILNARRGKYHLEKLTKRIDDRKLPRMQIVDMKREILSKRGNMGLSRPLVDKLIDRYERQEQSILFINRRGFSKSILCPDCGHVCMCPHCSVPVTYHKFDELMKCHLCGYVETVPHKCPACRSEKIRQKGFGTQRVEEAVRKILPKAKVFRMDADTMAKKNLFREILGDFRRGRIDVLVGTQMIAKGLDFPNVTLVGLVDADIALHLPDFRAQERTFQLLVQVSGRAGRGDRAGEVVVQTFTPQSSPIEYARQGDFEGFLENEIEQRKMFGYPPFRHLIHHLFQGRNPEKVEFFAEQWMRKVEQELGDRLEIRGPAPAALEKMKDQYRFQGWYFCPSVSPVIGDLQKLRADFDWPDDIRQILDVDPAGVI